MLEQLEVWVVVLHVVLVWLLVQDVVVLVVVVVVGSVQSDREDSTINVKVAIPKLLDTCNDP